MTTTTPTTASRCDRILTLIDDCLADPSLSGADQRAPYDDEQFENVLRSLTRSFPNLLPGELRAVARDLCATAA
jgi:hypothetical protein